jgi:hypothetical protein
MVTVFAQEHVIATASDYLVRSAPTGNKIRPIAGIDRVVTVIA